MSGAIIKAKLDVKGQMGLRTQHVRGQAASAKACAERAWTAKYAFGQHTRSNDVGRGLGRDVGLSLFHYGTGGKGQQCQQTQHHRDDSFCLFHVPFLSPGTALIAFSRTEDYNMRLHRRHRLVFVLLYHTRRYCQNKSVRKIHAL